MVSSANKKGLAMFLKDSSGLNQRRDDALIINKSLDKKISQVRFYDLR